MVVYSPACPTTTPGNMTLSFGFDQTDIAPTTMAIAQMSYHSITFPFWAGSDGAHMLNDQNSKPTPGTISAVFDVSRTQMKWYPWINATAFAALALQDRNMYSPGYLDVSSQGGPTAATFVGTIFVKYEIEFIEPISPSSNA